MPADALEGDLEEEGVGDCCQLTLLDGKGKGRSVPLNEELERAEISVRRKRRIVRRALRSWSRDSSCKDLGYR